MRGMARLATIDGVAIFVYADDHAPPHVHAYAGEHEVLLLIGDASVFQGALPTTQLKKAQGWLLENAVDALAAWARLNGGRS